MRREKAWIICLFVVGLLIHAFISSRVGIEQMPNWLPIAYGAVVSLAILAIATLANRVRIARLRASASPIDFMIRPINAIGLAVFVFLAFADAAFMTAYLTNDFDKNFGRILGFSPIFALAIAIQSTSYRNSENDPLRFHQ